MFKCIAVLFSIILLSSNGHAEIINFLDGKVISDVVVGEDGILWCSEVFPGTSKQDRVIRLDIANGNYEYLTQVGIPDDCSASKLAGTSDKNLWRGGKNYVFQYDGDKWAPHIIGDGIYERFHVNGYLNDITIGPNGDLICATSVLATPSPPYSYYSVISRYDGNDWKRLSSPDLFKGSIAHNLALSPDGTLWCGTMADNAAGVFSYNDSIWTNYVVGNDGDYDTNYINSLAAGTDSSVYCWSRGGGLLRLVDHAWISSMQGFPGGSVNKMAVDRKGVLWCGMNGSGLLKMDGSVWTRITMSDGLPSERINKIVPDKDAVYLTTDNGLSVLKSPYLLAHERNAIPAAIDLKVSPNPFNPRTIINYCLAESGTAAISIYTVVGQNICSLVSKFHEKGYHNIVWDGTVNGHRVSSGVYLIHLTQGERNKTMKVTLLK